MKYECTICGFIYDPADHNGVELPDNPDYECPACGAPASSFKPID